MFGHGHHHNPAPAGGGYPSPAPPMGQHEPTFKIFCRADETFCVTIRNDAVVLAPADPRDEFQHWYKDMRHSTRVKDEEGHPAFALVNRAAGLAVKHSLGQSHPVKLVPYNPEYEDGSVLWTESKDVGKGFRCIRMVNNINLNFDAFHGDKKQGGVRDGTEVVLWEWCKGTNQSWKILPWGGDDGYVPPPPPPQPAYGAAGYGQPPQPAYGGGGGYGHPPPGYGGGGYGQPPAPYGGGGYGQPPAPYGGGGYGQPPAPYGDGGSGHPPPGYGGGGYGQPPAPYGGGGYSQSQPPAAYGGGGYAPPPGEGHRAPATEATVRLFCRAGEGYSLTVRDGTVCLAPTNAGDENQHWVKDMRHSTRIKDEEGYPAFALVNKVTREAIKHSLGQGHPVMLVPYNPEEQEESVLWTESRDVGKGFRCIRMVSNIYLNFDAFHGDKKQGGVRDGTTVVLWEWCKGDNQSWKIVPW